MLANAIKVIKRYICEIVDEIEHQKDSLQKHQKSGGSNIEGIWSTDTK